MVQKVLGEKIPYTYLIKLERKIMEDAVITINWD